MLLSCKRSDFSAENEVLVGNLIRRAKDSERLLLYNFAPVLNSCKAGNQRFTFYRIGVHGPTKESPFYLHADESPLY